MARTVKLHHELDLTDDQREAFDSLATMVQPGLFSNLRVGKEMRKLGPKVLEEIRWLIEERDDLRERERENGRQDGTRKTKNGKQT